MSLLKKLSNAAFVLNCLKIFGLLMGMVTHARDSQGTSSVLLNWLRGKSTPKIVHNM
ncbi:unnamed protein product [Plutella xylostella]|uniref:(diamondback moth) hypothetical protein n=1 Tax=Plutella xylostella TaxID=51655 RepID=A0A8S4D154_PLUXY|nr:unnamed protein product [Plutella xylostella]